MRVLKNDEVELIKVLLMTNLKIAEVILPTLNNIFVEDMDDGGMGSFQFISVIPNSNRRLGVTLCEAEFLDMDGIPVCIALNFDKDNQLFELDVWKVDYSPVSRFPDLQKVEIKEKI